MGQVKVPQRFKYMQGCTACGLSKSRSQVVVGSGLTRNVTYMFIGEAPGREEDEEGLPFVGVSGRLLTDLMAEAGIDRRTVYITNLVKCRPPQNRKPSGKEVQKCWVHLMLQISSINPSVLVLVGGSALEAFLPGQKITLVHGKMQVSKRGVRVFPIIHPAAALRDRKWQPLILQDLKNLSRIDVNREIEFSPRIVP